MPVKIRAVVLTYHLNGIGLSLMQFELNQNNQVIINRIIPNQMVNVLQHLLGFIVTAAMANQNVTRALRILLMGAFQIIANQLGNDGEFIENLVIMMIDGAFNLGANPVTVSDEFNRYDITLAVVTDRILAPGVQDYYRTLAHYTGGDLMYLNDAPAILQHVILAAIYGEDTIRQAFHFRHATNIPLMVHHMNDMNEQIEVTDGVGDMLFNHGLSE